MALQLFDGALDDEVIDLSTPPAPAKQLRPFTGELDQPHKSLKPFTGALDGEQPTKPSFRDRLSEAPNGEPVRDVFGGVTIPDSPETELGQRQEAFDEKYGATTRFGNRATKGVLNIQAAARANRAANIAEELNQLNAGANPVSAIMEKRDPQWRDRVRQKLMTGLSEEISEYTRLVKEAGHIPTAPVVAESSGKGIGANIEALGVDPLAYIAETGVTSLPASIITVLPALIAARRGGTGPGMAAAGLSSAITDSMMQLGQTLEHHGVDMSNPAAITAAMQDPELLAAARAEAQRHGIGVGLFDALSFGLATKTMAPQMIRSTAGRELTNVAAQIPAQGLAGGLGEASGQVFERGEVYDPGQLVGEVVGEAISGPVDVLGAAAAGVRKPVPAIPAEPEIHPTEKTRADLESVLNDDRSFEAIKAERDAQAAEQARVEAEQQRQAEIDAENQARADMDAIADYAGVPRTGAEIIATNPDGQSVDGVVEGLRFDGDTVVASVRTAQGVQDVRTDTAKIRPRPVGDGTKAAPIKATTSEDIEQAAAVTDAEPSPAQKQSDNYRKGRVQFEEGHPLAKIGAIAIETAKGNERIAKDGSWAVTMPVHYGHLQIAEGADGDKADVFVGDDVSAKKVYVIDQINADTKAFDELKAMVAFPSMQAARAAYEASFSDGRGRDRIGAISEMTPAQFVMRAKANNLKKAVRYTAPAPQETKSDVSNFNFRQQRNDLRRQQLANRDGSRAVGRDRADGDNGGGMAVTGPRPAEARPAPITAAAKPIAAVSKPSDVPAPVPAAKPKPVAPAADDSKKLQADDLERRYTEADAKLMKSGLTPGMRKRFERIRDDAARRIRERKHAPVEQAKTEDIKPVKRNITPTIVLEELRAAGAAGLTPRSMTWKKMANRLVREGKAVVEGDKYVVADQKKRAEVKYAAKSSKEEKDLIIQHNITEENLLHAIRVGGIPVPSLAITKSGDAMVNFGEITLIGPAEMADPKGYAKTQVFGADIYSPRYPDISYRLDSKTLDKLNALLVDYRAEGKRPIYGAEVNRIDDLISLDTFKNYAKAKLGKDRTFHQMKALGEDLLREAGAQERIFRDYTNSGNRRYIPHSLENVVKILKKELRGGENFNYGLGSLRAHFTPRFRSLSEIKKEKGRIVTDENFEEVKKEIDKDFQGLWNDLARHHSYSKNIGFGDTITDTLAYSAKVGIPRALSENQFEDVPVDVQTKMAEFLEKLRHLPTEYFEAKILRAVDVSEFNIAVVPRDASPKVIDELKKRGLDIVKYKDGDSVDRKRVIEKATGDSDRNVRFQAKSDPVFKTLTDFWKLVANQDKAFQYKKTDAKDFVEIVKQMASSHGWRAAPVNLEDGKGVRLRLSVPEPDTMGDYDKTYMDVMGSDTAAPYVVIGGDGGRQGIGGSLAYQIAMTWAHNNNKVLHPDATITPINRLRRTEAMISSALRFGTTRHLKPHHDQYVGLLSDDDYRGMDGIDGTNKDQELKALRENLWIQEDPRNSAATNQRIFAYNLYNLLKASSNLAARREPLVDRLAFDPTRGFYVRSSGGTTELTDSEITELFASEGKPPYQTGIGFPTLKRAVITRSLLQRLQQDGVVSPALLSSERLSDWVKGILYSGGERSRPSDRFLAHREDFIRRVQNLARQVNPNARVAFVRELFGEGEPLRRSGVASGERQQIPAQYEPLKRLITMAFSYNDPETQFRHETLHDLRNLGLFKDSEWRLLEAEAEKSWKKTYDVPDTEEAIAYAYGDFRGGKKFATPIQTIFTKIKLFLVRLGNALRGMGFNTADDVFERIESGEVAAREASPAGSAELAYSAGKRADQTQTPEFRKWFGNSKVVDDNGKPLVVYHGTYEDFRQFQMPAFFAPNPEVASSYARGSSPHVMPVYLRVENPLLVRSMDDLERAVGNAVDLSMYNYDWEALEDRKVIRALERAGYDGVDFRDDQTFGTNRPHDSWVAFRPEQIKSAIGNRGTFDPSKADIRYSAGKKAIPVTDEPARIGTRIAELAADLTSSDKTFNLWHRTVGTQYHKARVSPEFKAVFDRTQDFLQDTSLIAIEAQSRAPQMVPLIEGLGDLNKSTPPKSDIKAVGDALFAGTLFGKTPLEGRVFTDQELKAGRSEDKAFPFKLFDGLNDKQIKLYRETLDAVNTSLEELAKSTIYRMQRNTVKLSREDFRDVSMEDAATNVKDAFDDRIERAKIQLDRHKNEKDDVAAKAAEAEIAELEGYKASIDDVVKKVNDLKAHGYFPLQRFGEYTVSVKSKSGKQEFFGMYEWQWQAKRAERIMKAQYPESVVTTGIMPKESFKMFPGLSPDIAELFAKHIQVPDENGAMKALADDVAFQAYLKNAVSDRSALKKNIHRKGIAGYSEDIPRVLAAFIVSGARLASSSYHMADAMDAWNAIPDRKGDVKDEAAKLIMYLRNPQEEAAALRAFMFFNYLGGSAAAALVNMTQPMLVTLPYMTKHVSYQKAAAMLVAPAPTSADYRGDLLRAKHEGVVSPQEIHQLMAEARAQTFGLSLPSSVQQKAHKASVVWGAFFSLAEQFNRELTFKVAWQVAKEKGMASPYEFAKLAVKDTQFVYGKGARPNWARGAIGATVFTFKQFTLSFVELAVMLAKQNPKALAYMLLTVWLFAGLEGEPFAEDMEDLIDTLGQWMGYGTNSKKWLRENLAAVVGEQWAEVMLTGPATAGLGVDVHSRLGLGNLIPGTSLFKKSETDRVRDVKEMIGPLGGLIDSADNAIENLAQGKSGKVLQSVAPKALKDAAQAIEMATTGEYRDTMGRKVTDVTKLQAAAKGFGLQPAKVARETRAVQRMNQDVRLQRNKEDAIADKIVSGIVSKDKQTIADARRELRDWNQKNPDMRIEITEAQINRRVQQMRMSRKQRNLKSTPPELRGQSARELNQ